MEATKLHNNREWKKRAFLLGVLDFFAVIIVYFAALMLRFDFSYSSIEQRFIDGYLHSILLWSAVTLVVFYFCRLYHSIWSLAGSREMLQIINAYILLIPLYALIWWTMGLEMPRSYYAIGYILSLLATTGMRFSYRILRLTVQHMRRPTDRKERIMIIGAGAAGQMIIKELRDSDKINSEVCCVIDDNPNKKGRYIEGVEIVGDRHVIVDMARKHQISTIIFAIPSSNVRDRSGILNICKETKCRLRTIPGVYQLVSDVVGIRDVRDVELGDLLGREQVQVNNDEIFRSISGKTVMVTGGGGSIGSELCRQIAKANPRRLIIFDFYDNNANEIQQELLRNIPELDLVTLIGSVRNTKRIHDVMQQYRPDIVFHAAAHKHVPVLEDSPNEAIKNNVFGTYKTAQAAAAAGVKKFVLISSDKAINPTNIMGASKRLCEMVVQMMDRQCPDTSFVAVRFGNVLGSNGSVVPLFKKQIAAGGPVTVTDKRIIRYFMTIPEAVSLVLQASYYAQGGEIFVMEMGEPVKIDDMARNLIRLAGLTPDVDIPIVYTGLRPGEKLYEELLMEEEGLQETENKLIHIGKPIEMDDEWFREKLHQLEEASKEETDRIRELVAQLVPTYHYSGAVTK